LLIENARVRVSKSSIRNQQSAVSRIISSDALQEAFPEDAEFFGDGQGDFGGEYVVLALGDFFQKFAVDIDEHPESGLAVLGAVGD
jgi:hypothetical protein